VRSGKQDCIDLLIGYQVNLTREDSEGNTLMKIAHKFKRPHIIDLLKELGVECPPEIQRKLDT